MLIARMSVDLAMKRLLIHALRSEAGLIRQRFPQATKPVCDMGIELRSLDPENDLLRTGMGLSRTAHVLDLVQDLDGYDQYVHFGVSGSLSDDLPPFTLVLGRYFMAQDQPSILSAPARQAWSDLLPQITFFSSQDAVQTEEQRDHLQSLGAGAVDMESYAVLHKLFPYNIPIIALRCISDRAGASTPREFKLQYRQASQNLQAFILERILNK